MADRKFWSIRTRPIPAIAPNEVLVRVRACALNHLDLWVRRGLPGIRFPLPHIPGSDIAGEVAQVGSLVRRVKVGPARGAGSGHFLRAMRGVCGRQRQSVPQLYALWLSRGWRLRGICEVAGSKHYSDSWDSLSFEDAAAIPVVFLTAWHMLITRAQLQPGEDVLVLAAGSGVGTAAIQIAKLTEHA